MNILIADDDAVSRLLLKSHLSQWGYEVAVARDGAEAWQMFQAQRPPMIICDWIMPELDGPDVIRQIRQEEGELPCYAILLTARNRKGDLQTGIASGADDFITKPFDQDELRIRLRTGERILELQRALHDAQQRLRRAGD